MNTLLFHIAGGSAFDQVQTEREIIEWIIIHVVLRSNLAVNFWSKDFDTTSRGTGSELKALIFIVGKCEAI